MNENEFRWCHCIRKISYKKRFHAEKKIAKMKREGIEDENLNIYHCKYCHKYHIGHKKVIKDAV